MLAARALGGALRPRSTTCTRAAFSGVSLEPPPPPSYRRTPSDYSKIYDAAAADRERFWLDAAQEVHWFRPPTIALDDSNAPFYRWFPDGTTNMCYNAVDRHVKAGKTDDVAIAYHSAVGGQSRDITYGELLSQVASFAGSLSNSVGVVKGDHVLIYMPMIPEALVAMLACTRIGAVHSVVFGGFAAPELAVRIADSQPKLVVTSTCGLEGAKVLPYMPLVDRALELATEAGATVETVVVHNRTESAATVEYEMKPGRDLDFDALSERGSLTGTDILGESNAPCVEVLATDPLYTIYTSGTTGKPKGVVRDNAHAVILKWSMEAMMGVRPGECYFSASDIGWVVGHSYIVYAPLLHGCKTVLFEGKPVGTPDASTYWRVVEQHGANVMFTAPTALRAIRKEDPTGALLKNHDISSLRTLFVAGERADPDTVEYFQNLLGIPVVDNWWQTESGSPMCGMQLESVGTVAGSCGLPLPGFDMVVLDPSGAPLPTGQMGSIAIRLPLPPGFMTTLLNNDQRYIGNYLTEFPGYYSAGDAGFMDDNGYIHIMARTDDVLNVAGHRLSTGQLEEACLTHPRVVECAVLGVKDALKGQVPVAMVVLSGGSGSDEEVVKEVVQLVREQVGAVASLRQAAVVAALPKTRSGKILRGVMRAIADGDEYSLPGTIDDAGVVEGVTGALVQLGYAGGSTTTRC